MGLTCNERFERQKAKALKTKAFFEVHGVSWRGNNIKRDGRVVCCGHEHRTRGAAERCAKAMRKLKPGNCPQYRAVEITALLIKKDAQ